MPSHLQQYLNLTLANSAAPKITILNNAVMEATDSELKKNLEAALFSLKKLTAHAKASTHEYLNAIEEFKDIKNTFQDLLNALNNTFLIPIHTTALSKDSLVSLINALKKVALGVNATFIDHELPPFLKKKIACCEEQVAQKTLIEKKQAFDKLLDEIQKLRNELEKYGAEERAFKYRFTNATIETKLHLNAIHLEMAILKKQQINPQNPNTAEPHTKNTDAPDELTKRKIMIAEMVAAYIKKRKKIYHDPEFKIIAQIDPASKEILRKFEALCQELSLLSDRDDTFSSMQDKHAYLIKTYPHAHLDNFLNEMLQKSFVTDETHLDREKNANLLFERIDRLKKHAEKMMASHHPRDQAYGLYTLDFANSLSEKAHRFFDFKSQATTATETLFKKEFTQLVKNEEKFMKAHRFETQKILSDILKGLGLVLSVVGAIVYYCRTKKSPFDFFLHHKTAREEYTDGIEETFTQAFSK